MTLQEQIRGDESTFTFIYNENLHQINRFVANRVNDAASAEDVTASIFMKAWQNLNTYEERGYPIRAWLFRIARNSVIDYYRTRKVTAPLELAENASDGGQPISDRIADQEQVQQIVGLLPLLTEGQRKVLDLRILKGLKTEEVAVTLQKGPGAVRALQMRGLRALAQLVKEHGLLHP